MSVTAPGEREARELLRAADSVVVLTGAGISADSGVPTFRGPEGLWKHYRPEELATPEAFARDPRLVWEWYGWRRERVTGCEPNAAHLALARWAAERSGVTIVTQNVDGLHARAASLVGAGVASGARAADAPVGPARPLELHGSLFRVRCTGCGDRWADRDRVDASSLDTLPRCAACGALARPDVVWFGEALERTVIERAFAAAEAASVCLVVGTSAIVHPAAGIPAATRRAGGRIVEVNPEPTPLSGAAAVSIRERAAVAVPSILATGRAAHG